MAVTYTRLCCRQVVAATHWPSSSSSSSSSGAGWRRGVHGLTSRSRQWVPSAPVWSVKELTQSPKNPMEVTPETLDKLLQQAMLKKPHNKDEIRMVTSSLSRLISFMQALQGVDTTGVAPLVSVIERAKPYEQLRTDNPEFCEEPFLLKMAPQTLQGYLVTPKESND